ncbi:MAG TPA: LOG family protein, partial [Chthoniobacterales bacterium]
MPKIRLSGTVLGSDDPSRASRARLLYLLFAAGWDIYNSNGDQRITLSNVERKIVESDAFVFTPGATLEDMFKAISIFVGYQTLDRNLAGKPTIILNEDGSWSPFFAVLSHLNEMGTVKQSHEDFLLTVDSPDAVLDALDWVKLGGVPDAGRHRAFSSEAPAVETPLPADYI